MGKVKLRTTIVMGFMLLTALGAPQPALARAAGATYAKMAPVDQYLMARGAEIALARSAAPASISRDATILVLGREGYETAVRGGTGSSASWAGRGAQLSTGANSGTRK
ncbi:MAG TPA: hypothetical protein VF292_05375 [Rhodanobacteraceae bacterium]